MARGWSPEGVKSLTTRKGVSPGGTGGAPAAGGRCRSQPRSRAAAWRSRSCRRRYPRHVTRTGPDRLRGQGRSAVVRGGRRQASGQGPASPPERTMTCCATSRSGRLRSCEARRSRSNAASARAPGVGHQHALRLLDERPAAQRLLQLVGQPARPLAGTRVREGAGGGGRDPAVSTRSASPSASAASDEHVERADRPRRPPGAGRPGGAEPELEGAFPERRPPFQLGQNRRGAVPRPRLERADARPFREVVLRRIDDRASSELAAAVR